MANPAEKSFCTREMLRLVLVMACSCLVGLTVGPPLSQRLKEGSSKAQASCPSCACDCSPQNELIYLSSDCGQNDPEMSVEMEKDTVELLSEEIDLHKTVTNNTLEHKKSLVMDTKRASSQYQREAEKCSFGVETCEEARERAEAELVEEQKLTALWERRAKDLGWKDSKRVYT